MFEFTCRVGDVGLILILIFSLSTNVMIDDVSLEVGLEASGRLLDKELTAARKFGRPFERET
jgi:hypothetical protein